MAWGNFSKHGPVLKDEHVSLSSRMKLFHAAVSLTVLYGLDTLPLTKSQLHKLDFTQRQMLRALVGWRRVEAEDWQTNTERMNGRVAYALTVYNIPK